MKTANNPLMRWATTFEEQVRSGEMSLLEVVEIAVSEMEHYNAICPQCVSDTVREGTAGYRKGECLACHFRRLRDAHNVRLREIIAKRENDNAKQRVKRLRDRLDELIDIDDEDLIDLMEEE